MKNQPKTALISVLSALSLAACGQNGDDDGESGQSKFNIAQAAEAGPEFE